MIYYLQGAAVAGEQESYMTDLKDRVQVTIPFPVRVRH